MTFLDTAIVIYLIEQPDDWGSVAKARFEELENSLEAFASTELVRMECLVAPSRNGDSATIQRFDRFLIPPHVQLVLIDRSVSNRAVGIRATYGFKSLDSLHLAAALEFGCNRFWTGDQRLRRFRELEVEVLELPPK